MKLSPLLASLLSFASFAGSLHAIPAAVGDLILGFRASAAPGSDTNLQINLGPASSFFGAAPGTTTILTRLSVQDLVDTYGSNWNTRADLEWGVVGSMGSEAVGGVPARTIWASKPEATPGTASTAWTRGSEDGLQNASVAIGTMYAGAPGSMVNFTATANSVFTVKTPSATSGSWTAQEDLVANQSFRRFTPTVTQTGNNFPTAGSAYDGTGYRVLDLYDIRPGSGASTRLGGIGLNNAGKLVFSTSISVFAPPSAPVVLGSPTITLNAGGTVTVSLTGAPAGNYTLERSTTLAAFSWTTLLTQSPVAGVLTFLDSNPPQPRGFYQIKKLN
jgi:hypothetical protein